MRGRAGLTLVLLFSASLAQAQAPDVRAADCSDLARRFERLIAVYLGEANREVAETGDIPKALDRARARAIAGDVAATVPMTGIPWLLRSNAERYTVSSVRQICTLAERNRLPLHITTCAYFTALNPLGERSEKRRLVEGRIAAFETLPPGGAPATISPAHLGEDIAFLKTCLPPD